jgi:outer membrane protein with beta-barrel domain
MKARTLFLRPLTVALALAGLGLTLSGPASAEAKKHHLGLAIGYEKHLSDDLKAPAFGIDFTNAAYGAFQYRYSVKENIDLSLDFRDTIHSNDSGGIKTTLTNGYWGPGVRLISPSGGMRPYVQANFLFVREEAKVESGNVTVTAHDNGAGFGVCGGVDIRTGNLVSIPIEVNYMYGKPSDDVSGVGINAGVTFNFGELK